MIFLLAQSVTPQPLVLQIVDFSVSDLISLAALSASIFAILYTRKNLHFVSRNNYMNLLVGIDKLLIDHPQLWVTHSPGPVDPNAVAQLAPQQPTVNQDAEEARRKGYIWMHINLFEVVWNDHERRLANLGWNRSDTWEAWKTYMRGFKKNDEVKAVIDSTQMRLVGKKFADFLRTL